MNSVYFACRTCKTYHDAGYRWCVATLEDAGIIARRKRIVVSAVLEAKEYWQPLIEAEADRLIELLPRVRSFLERHESHELTYGDGEEIGIVPMYDGDWEFLEWMNEDQSDDSDLGTRSFVERFGYRDWNQVQHHLEQMEHKPWWWYVPDSEYERKVREKFEALVTSVEGDVLE
jgi:hypothetical protein